MKVNFKTDDTGDDDDDLDMDFEDGSLEDRATVEIDDGADTAVELTDDPDEPDEREGRAEGDEDEDDDDLSAYSKPVRDRIRRERAEAQEARTRADAAERELKVTRAKSDLATIDQDINAAIDEVEEARRDADTRKEVLAQAKVTNLTARKEALTRTASDDEPEGGAKAPNAAVERWVGRNKAWWSDPKYDAQRQAALVIGRRLADRGLKDNSDEFYAELDKELRKSVRLPTDREPPERSTISRRMSGRMHQDPKSSRVTLSPADQRFMKQLKLDVTNKEHVKQYLTEKRNAR